MKKTSIKVIKITTGLALLLSLLGAIVMPLGYFVLAFEYQAAVLTTEVEADAAYASQIISENPDYWRFEQHRLEEFLSHRPFDKHNEIRSIVDTTGHVVAVSADPIATPLMSRSHKLFDSGAVVATMEISRSLRPLIIRTLLLAALGLLLGTGMFILLSLFPLRALQDALRSLQESEGKFSAIASTAADAIVVIDEKGKISYWNTAAERMFGYSMAEVIGRELHLMIAPERYRESYQKGFKIFRRSGKGPAIGNTLEFIAVRKDGTEFPIEVSTSTIPAEGAWHAVGIVRDITERKKTERELLKLEKLESLGVLAGGLAHDFNNLLAVILGNISLALVAADPEDPTVRRLRDVEKAVLRAQDLTRQLLTFSKGGAPVRQTTSIREIIEESCRFALSGSNVTCSFSFAPKLMPVNVDAGQIGQVLNNLVINAVHAMPDSGAIDVTVENVSVAPQDVLQIEPGEYVRITVRDYGVGIPRENLSKIFDPYFTTKREGSGLGLATSYSIIKRHEGHLAVESEPGKGAAFFLYLPASFRKPSDKEKREEPPVAGRGRILVMDDEPAVRAVAGEMLKAIGYEFELAKDGSEAIDLYTQALNNGRSFDAAIMDLTIPGGMGGKETMKKLAELDPTVKAIVASGYSNDPVIADFKAYGFAGVISKPYDLQALSNALSTVLS